MIQLVPSLRHLIVEGYQQAVVIHYLCRFITHWYLATTAFPVPTVYFVELPLKKARLIGIFCDVKTFRDFVRTKNHNK
jgi:hypothetical protein